MIPRYQRPAMRELWSLESQYAAWLEVELAVAEAYELVQRRALKAHEEKLDFKTPLLAEPGVRALIKPDEMEAIFQPDRFLEHVEAIFERVFEDRVSGPASPRLPEA